MADQKPISIGLPWNSERPHVLVIACSDGRLQVATDAFLGHYLSVSDYDRLYIPGGGGALSPSGRDFIRARQHQQECRMLVDVHDVEAVVMMFHGPTADGPPEAVCADYLRKNSYATVAQHREQQEKDVAELLESRWQWAGNAAVAVYRCEISADRSLSFVTLHADRAFAQRAANARIAPTVQLRKRQ